MPAAVVIGGGISGLSTAYYLAKAGIPCTLIESRPRLGGLIQTEHTHGCVVEGGPDSFLAAKPWAMDLIRELGLADEVIESNDHLRKTFIWKSGRLVPLPEGLQFLAPTKFSPLLTTKLFGWPTKVRMGLEWFRRAGACGGDRSVAEFVREHYGQEAVDYLAEPLLAGIYGGDPEALSVSSVLPQFVELELRYGSLTRGVMAARKPRERTALFRTLKGGLGQLVEALRSALPPTAEIRHATAEQVERHDHGFRVRLNGDWIEARHLVFACAAYDAASIAGSIDVLMAELLNSIPYSSSVVVALGYEQRTFTGRSDGFGFLVPKRERRRLVACTWVGTKFPHRVPEGLALLRCFLSGEPSEADDRLVESVGQELQLIMGVHAQPLFSRVFRWPRSMPQYNVGHQQRVSQIESRLAAIPGLHLAGNAYSGVGIPDCVRSGKQVADRIASSISG